MFKNDTVVIYNDRIIIQSFEERATFKEAFSKESTWIRSVSKVCKGLALDLAHRVEHAAALLFFSLTAVISLPIIPFMHLASRSDYPKTASIGRNFINSINSQMILLKNLSRSFISPALIYNDSLLDIVIMGYLEGSGTKKDEAKGKSLIDKHLATNDPNPSIIRTFGETYDQENKYDLALKQYLLSAESGDVTSQVNVADMYYTGEGVKQDLSIAKKWYEKAAEQEHPEAQYRLSGYFRYGYANTKIDLIKADDLLKKAAKGDDPDAMSELGLQHYRKGTPKDLKIAKQFFELSAKQGNSNSYYMLGIMHLDGKGVKQDFKKALHWIEKSAKSGNTFAQYELANLCLEGKIVKTNKPEAKKWLSLAANQNHASAQLKLAKILLSERTTDGRSEAKVLLQKAAKSLPYAKELLKDLIKQDHRNFPITIA